MKPFLIVLLVLIVITWVGYNFRYYMFLKYGDKQPPKQNENSSLDSFNSWNLNIRP